MGKRNRSYGEQHKEAYVCSATLHGQNNLDSAHPGQHSYRGQKTEHPYSSD
jgi:hypothetical protein